jgi:hypothetical protein
MKDSGKPESYQNQNLKCMNSFSMQMGDSLLTHLITKSFRSNIIGMARELKRQKGDFEVYGYSETYKGFDLIDIVKLD